jgi:hypothetical protein
MTRLRRRHLLPAAVLAGSAALFGVGCSGGGDQDGEAATTDAVGTGGAALDGVRVDVRRDPG